MDHELVTVDVEVKRTWKNAILVTDGDTEGWIPYSLLGDESTVDRDCEAGDTGVVEIPAWKAEELGFA